MRIYLSGPITGTQDAEQRFAEAEARLRDEYFGAEIINPVRAAAAFPPLTHDEYMIISFAMMDVCDSMYQMEGWKQSRGCNQEAGYAFAKRIPILPALENLDEVEVEEL